MTAIKTSMLHSSRGTVKSNTIKAWTGNCSYMEYGSSFLGWIMEVSLTWGDGIQIYLYTLEHKSPWRKQKCIQVD